MSSQIWDSPLRIRKTLLKNRIVFPPVTTNWANPDGTISNKMVEHYSTLARGGCGMIVVEGTAISPEGKGTSNSLCLYDKNHLQGLELLAKTIKENNCFVSLQLNHAGGQANPNFTNHEPLSPSGVICNSTGFNSRPMSSLEIKEIRNGFISASKSAYDLGFDAVEFHLAHGYLLHEFLSAHTNKRQDEYGGSLVKRMKLILEIIDGTKKESPNLILGVRISGEDYIHDGINKKINEEILPIIEEREVDYFSVTAGVYDTSKFKHEAMGRGDFFKYSQYVKEIVTKPVIGVGKVLDLNSAERHLFQKECDLVAMGRAHIADPEIVRKTKANLEIDNCIQCDECSYLKFGRSKLFCPTRGI